MIPTSDDTMQAIWEAEESYPVTVPTRQNPADEAASTARESTKPSQSDIDFVTWAAISRPGFACVVRALGARSRPAKFFTKYRVKLHRTNLETRSISGYFAVLAGLVPPSFKEHAEADVTLALSALIKNKEEGLREMIDEREHWDDSDISAMQTQLAALKQIRLDMPSGIERASLAWVDETRITPNRTSVEDMIKSLRVVHRITRALHHDTPTVRLFRYVSKHRVAKALAIADKDMPVRLDLPVLSLWSEDVRQAKWHAEGRGGGIALTIDVKPRAILLTPRLEALGADNDNYFLMLGGGIVLTAEVAKKALRDSQKSGR